MADKKLDIVIFGATGFTGKYVVKEFMKYGHKKYSWGIAGRNKSKLEEVLNNLKTETDDLQSVAIIVADCENKDSINEMAKRAKVIINCCGPYRFYGEVVVQACVENGCHHVDVSGEPEYMERMQVKYSEEAAKKNIYIISACGFDCVPSDLGVVHFMNNFDGILNAVEIYLEMKGSGGGPACNYGTWQSAVHEYLNVSNRKDIRAKLFPKEETPVLKPKLENKPPIHKSAVASNKYCVPFPGADASVVRRSQFLFYKLQKQRPVQCHAFLVCQNVFVLTGLIIIGMFLNLLSRFSFGVKLLLNYPEFFTFGLMSRKEPSVENVDKTSAVFRFHGEGWNKESVEGIEDKTTISLPTNKTMDMTISFESPGYGFTSRSVIFSAITILEEADKMPSTGGVFTPAAAFYNTKFLDRLVENGVKIEFVKSTA